MAGFFRTLFRPSGGDTSPAGISVTDSGQLGAGNLPGLHRGPAGVWAGSNAEPDPRRTAGPVNDPGNAAYRQMIRGRGWRGITAPTSVAANTGQLDGTGPGRGVGSPLVAVQPGQGPAGAPGPAVDGAHLRDTDGTAWVGNNAVADPRRVWDPEGKQAGYPLAGSEALIPQAEHITNTRLPLEVTRRAERTLPGDPAFAVRAGSTGVDEARPATMPVWLFGRAFDQLAAERLNIKAAHAAPTASTPLFYADGVPGAVPAPGGGRRAPGHEGINIQPNSWRLVPKPWDERAINTGQPGDPAQAAANAARRRGWRAM